MRFLLLNFDTCNLTKLIPQYFMIIGIKMISRYVAVMLIELSQESSYIFSSNWPLRKNTQILAKMRLVNDLKAPFPADRQRHNDLIFARGRPDERFPVAAYQIEVKSEGVNNALPGLFYQSVPGCIVNFIAV